ncbi:hypothetical protein [Psittacicella gerlachiana]|nr:hypothetical protein [Psittacicella gerlachiana]
MYLNKTFKKLASIIAISSLCLLPQQTLAQNITKEQAYQMVHKTYDADTIGNHITEIFEQSLTEILKNKKSINYVYIIYNLAKKFNNEYPAEIINNRYDVKYVDDLFELSKYCLVYIKEYSKSKHFIKCIALITVVGTFSSNSDKFKSTILVHEYVNYQENSEVHQKVQKIPIFQILDNFSNTPLQILENKLNFNFNIPLDDDYLKAKEIWKFIFNVDFPYDSNSN